MIVDILDNYSANNSYHHCSNNRFTHSVLKKRTNKKKKPTKKQTNKNTNKTKQNKNTGFVCFRVVIFHKMHIM